MTAPGIRARRERVPSPGIVIVGAGPAGLACALSLASFDVPCVLLDERGGVSDGSRATGISRRSLQLLTPSGVADDVMGVAVVQRANQAFIGTRELFLDLTPAEPGKYPRVVNIPQDLLERIIVAAVRERPAIELRRGHRVEAVRSGHGGVELDVVADGADVRLDASWLIVCDGANSAVRRSQDLPFKGPRYETRFIVTDVRARLDLPDGVRRIWFDPPSNPGGTIIMHQQPEGVWRIDFGLADVGDRTALSAGAVRAKVDAHLRMLDAPEGWEIIWQGDYTASSVTLESYRHGRIFFAGDAAHLIPIFGGRGMNSAIEDGFNLGWKLAAVIQGGADEALLDTYSNERVEGAWQNLAKAGVGAEVIAARSPGSLVLRQAALALMLGRRPALASLLNHRTTDANIYSQSPLNLGDCGAGAAARPGQAMPDALAARPDGTTGYLSDALGGGFTVLEVGRPERADRRDGGAPRPESLLGLPLAYLAIDPVPAESADGEAPGVLYDHGTYLIRPDRYVMASSRAHDVLEAAAVLPYARAREPVSR